MKKWILDQIKKKQEARSALVKKGKTSDNIEEIRSIQDQVDAIDSEIAEFRTQLETIEAEERTAAAATASTTATGAPAANTEGEGLEQRGAASPVGPTAVMATYGVTQPQQQQRSATVADPTATVEYRTAFMKFCQTGEMGPELREDAMTSTTDVSAVIPSTILNEVIRKVEVYGQVFARVRKLSVKGGVTIPILSLKPSATWITQSTVSDKQKVTANTNVTFSYYGLECKVSVSLLADTVTLTGFENTITDIIVEAMVKAIDTAIIAGDGSGEPLGITLDPRVPEAQIVTISAEDMLEWGEWKKHIFAAMPLSYKAGAVFLMASGTFEGYIDGMVDTIGQPIGRINYGITEGAQERFGGKEVILVEDDIIAPYDDADEDDVIAIYCNLKDYGFNSNMQMTMFRYLDHDTNEWVDKAILIADGKLIDPNGVVIVKKGASAAS